MIVDSHCHLFTRAMMDHMGAMPRMLTELHLDVVNAKQRLSAPNLEHSARDNDVRCCLLLPTASPGRVRRVNGIYEEASRHRRLCTLGTLHPDMEDLEGEMKRLLDRGRPGIKLSSFSQRFELLGDGAREMFEGLQGEGVVRGFRPKVVLDTYTRADEHFDADPRHLTTPARLMEIVRRFRGLDFIGAHMGGLSAEPESLVATVRPEPNLYLDTSNAGHVLPREAFVRLVHAHGPERILFGTDWPWFGHAAEVPFVLDLLEAAGLDAGQRDAVMGGNALDLWGLWG